MNLKQVKGMSEEGLNTEMARICDWKPKFLGYAPDDGSLGNSNCEARYTKQPKYASDLNIMGLMEKTFLNSRTKHVDPWLIYIRNLRETVNSTDWSHVVTASARERAEAFIMTLG